MISFLAMGDMGDFQSAALQQTIAIHEACRNKIDAVLVLGDNFYERGVDSEDDPRWETLKTLFSPYCPWYAVLGNHDYLGDFVAQIRRSSLDSFWNMPHRYYEKRFFFPSSRDGVHLFALDTFELSRNESAHNSQAMGMTIDRFQQIFFSLQGQMEWFEQALAASDMKWKVVMGHYPLYSSGGHGNNPELLHLLEPLFHKYGVDMYLCGHDHHLEHVTELDTHYIVSGASSRYYPPSPQSISTHSTNGRVAAIQFYPTHAVLQFLGASQYYQRTILPNRTQSLKV